MIDKINVYKSKISDFVNNKWERMQKGNHDWRED